MINNTGKKNQQVTEYDSGSSGILEQETLTEKIAGSANPEAEFNKYLYQTGLANVFSLYQKNIANLDSARQKDIKDAYFIREMSKKYLGEYASDAGIGDVSGNLIDIYGKYAENITDINANYDTLKAGYDSKMLAESQDLATKLLGAEVSLQMSEYAETVLDAQTTIGQGIQTGEFGDFDNYEDYINSLDIPDTQKNDLLDWAKSENDVFEQTSFTQINGVGVNQTDLDRFGLSAQPNLDLSYYTNADIMSDYAYSRNGNMYGVATESTDLPSSALEGFDYRKDGNGFITYQGDTYVYMQDGTFHKMVQVEVGNAKIPTSNQFLEDGYAEQGNKVTVGVVTYKKSDYVDLFLNVSTDVLSALGLEKTTQHITQRMGQDKEMDVFTLKDGTKFSGTKVLFYNGRYYSVSFRDGVVTGVNNLEKE